MKYLLMDDGMKYRVIKEDGRYYYCDDQKFRKSNPHIVDVIIEKKASKKRDEAEEIKEEEE